MPVDKNDVEHIAKLARLSLTDEEIHSFTGELNSILEYMEKLNELDTEDVEPLAHPLDMNNVYREDKLRDSISTDEALKNAPDKDKEYFKVPKVIKQGD